MTDHICNLAPQKSSRSFCASYWLLTLKIDEHIKYWIDSADNDLAAAEDLLNSGRFDWCLFIGHLVLEKALKAIYIKINAELSPPKFITY